MFQTWCQDTNYFYYTHKVLNPIAIQAWLTELKLITVLLRLHTYSVRIQTCIQVVTVSLLSFYCLQQAVVAVGI